MKINSSTSRRQFIKNTLWATGAFAFPSIVRAEVLGLNKRVSPSNKLNIGSIGLGKMGFGDLNWILDSPDVRVTSLCDVETKRLGWAVEKVNKKYKDNACKFFSDFRQLIAQPDLDGVIISTQDHWHGVMALQAIKAGKAVYLQKPIALTHYEGQQIVAAVKRYNTILQVGSQQRSEESFHTACEIVRNGHFGRLKNIKVALSTNMVSLMDFAPHHADIAQWGSNQVHSGPVEIQPPGLDEKSGLKFTYANGVTMECGGPDFVSQGKEVPKEAQRNVLFECEGGWVMCGRGNFLKASDPEVLRRGLDSEDIRLFRSRNHYQCWVDSIRNNHPPVAPAEGGHRSATFGWLGNICIELNRPLKWDPNVEQFENDPEANARLRRVIRGPWSLS